MSTTRRWLLLALVSAGSSIMYYIPYLRWVFPDQMVAALDISNQQLGQLMSAYAITALVCYLPAGILADKIRMRTLSWIGYLSTAALLFVYATLPSFGVMILLMIALGVTTILIWWGTRFKLVRLLFAEDQYQSRIGWSYMFFALAGLAIGNGIAQIILRTYGEGYEANFLRVLLIVVGSIIAVMGVLSLLFVPKFDNEFDPNAARVSLSEFWQALRNPAVIFAAVTMFSVYFVNTSMTYTTQWLTMGPVLASTVIATNIANLRSYGVGVISGPVGGTLTKIVGSTSKMIMGISTIVIGILLVFIFVPWGAGTAVLAAVIVLVMAFFTLAQFYIASGQLTEARVPTPIFGAATGVLSLVGFLPDTFRDIIFGGWVDDFEAGTRDNAFQQIFWVVVSVAVVGIIASYGVLRISRKKAKAEELAGALV
ncbi:MAG: MFS transporter [Promicromonosporaceae bacterium]|nr:MFS transporter [Promicromonosporaceae bacterium]